MEWPAEDQYSFIKRLGRAPLGIYYDLGNATSQGYNPAEEIRVFGDLLVGLHIKDRKVGGGSVFLGEGDTDFVGSFRALKEIGYRGPMILETPRGSDPVITARKHLSFVRQAMANVGS